MAANMLGLLPDLHPRQDLPGIEPNLKIGGLKSLLELLAQRRNRDGRGQNPISTDLSARTRIVDRGSDCSRESLAHGRIELELGDEGDQLCLGRSNW